MSLISKYILGTNFFISIYSGLPCVGMKVGQWTLAHLRDTTPNIDMV